MSITASNAPDSSERLAQALGVSGDRIRQAMLATMWADLEAVPPEPMTAIATQLGKTPAEVCAAFGPPSAGAGHVASARPGRHTEIALALGGTVIHINSATADELREPAQRLGVSPERLLAAVRAAVPTAPPPPPTEDEILRRLANNLGIGQDQVRSAIRQVQGKEHFFFVVPLPDMGR